METGVYHRKSLSHSVVGENHVSRPMDKIATNKTGKEQRILTKEVRKWKALSI